MILVTVGSQGAFDRLVRAVDGWAGAQGRADVLAQIGPAAWKPAHVRWTEFLDAATFRTLFHEAELVVAHAGIGTLVCALELGKPIVVMPRRARLGEHRNDHQVATAEHFCRKHGVPVAASEKELAPALEEALRGAAERRTLAPAVLAPSASLVRSVRAFIAAPAAPLVPRIPWPPIQSRTS